MAKQSAAQKFKDLDPTTMSEEQLREYVGKLEMALADLGTATQKSTSKPWLEGEKREVFIPRTPTNDVITINGKPYIGRMMLDFHTYSTVLEIHGKAVRSELARMQQRGNLVAPHLLERGDITSHQPQIVANL